MHNMHTTGVAVQEYCSMHSMDASGWYYAYYEESNSYHTSRTRVLIVLCILASSNTYSLEYAYSSRE